MYFVYLGISLQQLLLIRILIFQFNLLPLHKKYIYKCLSLWKIPLSLQSSLEINVSLLRRYFNELSGDWLSWGCVRLPAKLIEQFSSRRAASEADRINYNWYWRRIPILPQCPCLGVGKSPHINYGKEETTIRRRCIRHFDFWIFIKNTYTYEYATWQNIT